MCWADWNNACKIKFKKKLLQKIKFFRLKMICLWASFKKKIFFFDPDPDPNPLVRDSDPGIRIRTNIWHGSPTLFLRKLCCAQCTLWPRRMLGEHGLRSDHLLGVLDEGDDLRDGLLQGLVLYAPLLAGLAPGPLLVGTLVGPLLASCWSSTKQRFGSRTFWV